MAIDRLTELQRWELAGGVWRVVATRGDSVTVSLCQCDGGEEQSRFTTQDPSVLAFLGGRSNSED